MVFLREKYYPSPSEIRPYEEAVGEIIRRDKTIYSLRDLFLKKLKELEKV